MGILLILIGGISYFSPGFLGVQNWVNAYYASQPLLVVAILLLLAKHKDCKNQ